MNGALGCWYQSPTRRDSRREKWVFTTGSDFKKNCSWIQILAPWRAWKTLDPQKENVRPHVPCSHPVWGRDVRDMNTHGILQVHH